MRRFEIAPGCAFVVDGDFATAAQLVDIQMPKDRQQPCAQVSEIDEGDVIDLGDRAFEVLHLPGHSPGSIGLWHSSAGVLFSGDAIYDGPLLDELGDSSIDQYCVTMERLMALPVTVVHAGHDPSFGRDRLRQLAAAYLQRRRP